MNFKIGDKVKVNKWVGGIPKDFNGIGEVISINTNSPYPVRVNIGYDIDYGFLESELELYKKVEGDKMSKFKVGDKVRIVKMEKDILEEVNIGDVGTILKDLGKNYDYALTVQIDRLDDYFDFREEELELYKEEYEPPTIISDGIIDKKLFTDKGYSINKEDKMGKTYKEHIKTMKTFKEVIRDIKQGEVWETKRIKIWMDSVGIVMDGMAYCTTIGDGVKFKLQRKEYTFKEAFKAYEEGKEIESYVTGIKCKKRRFPSDSEIKDYYNFSEVNEFEKLEEFAINEIRGKWYIN